MSDRLPTRSPHTSDWTPEHVTRSLLGWGVVAGPLYVVVSVTQALTRDGFDLARHQWSLLANGELGWVQTANLIAAGLMVITFALGLRRALHPGAAATWASLLIMVFGASMVAAGIFRADPALGFPPGAPEVGQMTTAGLLHFTVAGVGFLAVAGACFVLARRQARDGVHGLAWFSRVTAVTFLGGFLAVASGAGSVAANLLFTAAVVLVYSWVAVVAVHQYRALGQAAGPAERPVAARTPE